MIIYPTQENLPGYIENIYSEREFGDYESRKKLRDSHAREFRKLGYKVKVKTLSFADLSRSFHLSLEAIKK